MSFAGTGSIQLLTAYRLVRQITKPWDEWDAFELGLIDKNGKKIRDSKTKPEQESMGLMKVLAANIKRLVQRLPGGKSKFGSLAAALFLLKEEMKLNEETIEYIIEELNIEVPYIATPPNALQENVIIGDKLIRNIKRTDDTFLHYWTVYEGKDIISGKNTRFIMDEEA